MSSIHAQIYPGEGDELTKHTKIYIKTDKPLGSERDIDSIDFTVNERYYHRNELNRLKLQKRRANSAMKQQLFLSKYDINDPDIAIFKRMELLEKIINEGGNQFLIDEKEEKEEKSIINCEGESKKEEEEENINQNININNIKEDKILAKDDNSPKNEENQKNNLNSNINKNHKLIKNKNKRPKLRAASAKRENKQEEELSNINNSNRKFPRAMSAHVMRPLEKKNDYYVHNVYLSSRNKLGNKNVFRNNYNKRLQGNKLNDVFDENKKGNTSSQISTYEGINNSIYEKQNIPRHGFPFKSNHQIQNKMYLKINKRLKEKQYEKDQKKLEEFSKLIHLDDAFLSEDLLKEKFDINNNSFKNNHNNINNDLIYIDKNKIFNRPLSS